MAEARQVIKYTFVKVDAQVLAWPVEERQAAADEFAQLLEARAVAGTLLAVRTALRIRRRFSD